jgi:uncharacterized protein (TIGR02145 family)
MQYGTSTYQPIKIGTRVLFNENLNYYGAGVCYDNDPDNCETYGRLYTRAEAMIACPEGWKLPSANDFEAIKQYVYDDKNSSNIDYRSLRSKTLWTDAIGTDEYGFNGKPAGNYDSNYDHYDFIGSDAYFWTSDTYIHEGFYKVYTFDKDWNMEFKPVGRQEHMGFSVRCFQDGK